MFEKIAQIRIHLQKGKCKGYLISIAMFIKAEKKFPFQISLVSLIVSGLL